MKKLITYIVLLGLSPLAYSQNLSEEVVIERNIEPVERAVVRPSWVTPTILNAKVKSVRLSFNEYYNTAELTRSIATLQPIAWSDSVMRNPYRGYASAGYFPAYNLELAAGYQLVKKKSLTTDVHIAFQGSSWKGGANSEGSNSHNEFEIGLDLAARFNPGTLTANFDYKWSGSWMEHQVNGYDRGNQALNSVDLNIDWQPTFTGKVGWNVGFDFGFGGFTKSLAERLNVINSGGNFKFDPVKDLSLGLTSDLSYKLADKSYVDLGIGLNFRHTNSFNTLVSRIPAGAETAVLQPEENGSQTLGIITLNPGYRFATNNITGRLGVQFDFNTGGMEKNVHLAPNIDIEWSPSSFFAASLNAKGGEIMNTNAQLWQNSPWMTGVFAFERSHLNADAQINLTFGSYKGFWALLSGGWSSASNWITPVVIEGINTWQRRKEFNGFNFGVELGYAWKDKFIVKGHLQGAQHGKYYLWQDNAKWVFDIAAKVRPIEKLQVEVGYTGRLARRGYVLIPQDNDSFQSISTSLGNTSNLFVGAEYQISRAFSAFVKAENLLNRHWSLATNVRSPGVHGLLGVQYLF